MTTINKPALHTSKRSRYRYEVTLRTGGAVSADKMTALGQTRGGGEV